MNTLLLFYLFVGHLLGDYPLQSRKLIEWKQRSLLGSVGHGAIHALTTALLLMPFWGYREVVWAVVWVGAVHALVDMVKIHFSLNAVGPKTIAFYVGDQLFHGVVLVVVWIFLLGKLEPQTALPAWYAWRGTPVFLIAFLALTYVWDVTVWVFKNAADPHPYRRDVPSMMRRGIAVAVAFGVAVILSAK